MVAEFIKSPLTEKLEDFRYSKLSSSVSEILRWTNTAALSDYQTEKRLESISRLRESTAMRDNEK
jgi:hypothetical protein